ncbi:MAG: plasmid stabilization system protein ParE [Planctomycetota bacterium]|jgi:plasmid stabilization system protein ParE
MGSYELTPDAAEDREQIVITSRRKQTEHDVTALPGSLAGLAAGEKGEPIVIIAILHEKMDLIARLHDRLDA